MKICHVTSVHSLNDGRILEKECNSLANCYDDVFLVGIGESGQYNRVVIKGLSIEKTNRLKRLFSSLQVVKYALSLNCDVYHLHDPELLFFANSIKKSGHKVIFDSHEDIPRQIYDKKWIPACFRNIVSLIYEKYEKKVCKRLDGVVVATEKIQTVFQNYGIPSVVVHNYPIIDNSVLPTKLADNKQLCFAGSLSESNGLIQLIDVVESMPNIKLILAGKMDSAVAKRYEKVSTDNRFFYLGTISKKEVIELYRNSEIGMVADLPTGNNVDGLPIKLFEYMNAGLPIITSNFPLRKAIFDKFCCGVLIDPLNIEEYKSAIEKIISDAPFRIHCRENGIKAITTEYNWGNEEKTLIKLYKSLEHCAN